MTKPTKQNDLLDHAASLNATLEQSYLGLALVLVEIESTEAWKEAGRDSFAEYYREDLGREKSTVSRLLTCGKWLKEHSVAQLPTVSYRKLAGAISQNPEATPEKVLAIAQTWSPDDFKAQAKEDCKEHDFQLVCIKCWKKSDHKMVPIDARGYQGYDESYKLPDTHAPSTP